MKNDEQAVEAHVDVVRMQLQAARARRGGPEGPFEERAVATVVAFADRAKANGHVPAFDAIVAALGAWAEQTSSDERAGIVQMIDYLRGAEAAALRLAQIHGSRPRREAEADAPSPYLVPSRGAPSVHAEYAPPSPGVRVVEPHAKKQLERSVRDALEEIASVSWLRHAGDDDAWTLGIDFERRLLACLDAAAAYGRGPVSVDVPSEALRLAKDFPIVDVSRWFAAGFLLSCTKGDRAPTALRQLMLEAPLGSSAGLVDALCLGSSHRMRSTALSLIEEDDRADLLHAGLVACLRLGVIDENLMTPLLDHPRGDVASLAARCLARGEATAVAPRLTPFLDRSDVALEAAFSLAIFRAEVGPAFLRSAAARGLEPNADDGEKAYGLSAALFLALLGKKRDVECLLRIARADDAGIAALADHGSPDFIPWLKHEMLSADASRSYAAAVALARMTGTALEERGDADDAPPFDPAPFAKRVAGFVVPPSVERIRLGKKLDLQGSLAELLRPSTRQSVRRRVEREAAVWRGAPLPVDIDGWISIQSRTLRELGVGAGAPS